MTPECVYIIVDAERLADLADLAKRLADMAKRFDTAAETCEASRVADADMAKRAGIPCHVLGVTDTVEPEIHVRWTP